MYTCMYTHRFVGCCLATKTFDLEQSGMDVAVGCLVARDDITNKLHSLDRESKGRIQLCLGKVHIAHQPLKYM